MKCIDCGIAIEHHGICADCLARVHGETKSAALSELTGLSVRTITFRQDQARQEQSRVASGRW